MKPGNRENGMRLKVWEAIISVKKDKKKIKRKKRKCYLYYESKLLTLNYTS